MAHQIQQIKIKNRKAEFEYFLLTKFTAGIVLTGTEIKSIRQGKVNLTDAWCRIDNDELWVVGLHIAEYSHGGHYNHTPLRERKLLVNKKEIRKLTSKMKEKGTSIIPTLLFINEKGYAKLDIALAKGKRQYDKRETIKEKDVRRDLDRLA
ncbi:MAG: SsrA-binding protein SmpB [Bacteroidota bacterium]|jgi:SsrA-binding protein